MKGYSSAGKVFLVMLLLLYGCRWLKQTTKTTNTAQQELKLKTEVTDLTANEVETKALEMDVGTAANGAEYVLHLWPKGKFSFSAEKGFEGEADSLKMESNDWEFENHSKITDTDVLEKNQQTKVLKQDEKLVTKQKETVNMSFADYKLVLCALILLFFGVIWILKGKKIS